MEGRRIRNITKSEATILLYLNNRGIKKAKDISKNLEIDISYVYKILNILLDKKMIIKQKSNDGDLEYKAIEDIVY